MLVSRGTYLVIDRLSRGTYLVIDRLSRGTYVVIDRLSVHVGAVQRIQSWW